MSQLQHTPGNWRASFEDGEEYRIITDHVPDGAGHWMLPIEVGCCFCEHGPDDMVLEPGEMGPVEARANVLLMAEAPRLLERLSELIALVELDPDNVPGTDLYTEILLSKQAIHWATHADAEAE